VHKNAMVKHFVPQKETFMPIGEHLNITFTLTDPQFLWVKLLAIIWELPTSPVMMGLVSE
jgi:hypothetical protein